MRGFGHRPDRLQDVEEDLILRHVSELVGVAAPRATSRDWRHLDPTVLSQGSSNTCVPHAGSTSLYMFAQGSGHPIQRPSIRHAYLQGQLEDQRLDGIPRERRQLLDIGMRARSMLVAWSTYGIVSEARWPFDDTKVTEPLPFDLDVAAADAKLTGWYRADSGTMSQSFRRALDARTFPIVAIDVHESFEQISGVDGYEYDEPSGAFLGRHMICIVGYRPGFVLMKNSWGSSWCDDGYCWLSNRFLDSENTRDGWILTAAPALT